MAKNEKAEVLLILTPDSVGHFETKSADGRAITVIKKTESSHVSVYVDIEGKLVVEVI